MFLRHLAQPLLGNVHGLHHRRGGDLVETFEGGGKGAVEFVEVALVFDHHRAGEIVKRLHVIGGQTGLEPFQKRKIFAQ